MSDNTPAGEATSNKPANSETVATKATATTQEKPLTLQLGADVVTWGVENLTKLADLVATAKNVKNPRQIQGAWERVIGSRPEFQAAVATAIETKCKNVAVALTFEERSILDGLAFKRSLSIDALIKDLEIGWTAVLENLNK